MNRSERDEWKRAALRFQELCQPHKVIEMIERLNELEDQEIRYQNSVQVRKDDDTAVVYKPNVRGA